MSFEVLGALTIEAALTLPILQHARVVAGKAGLGRSIRTAHILDLIDIAHWVRGGELVLSTGVGWAKDTQAQSQYLQQAADSDVSGIMLAVGGYWQHIPPEMCRIADNLDLPLIEIPWDIAFIDIVDAIGVELAKRQQALSEWSDRIHSQLSLAAVEVYHQADLLKVIGKILHTEVLFYAEPHNMLLSVPVVVSGRVMGFLGIEQHKWHPVLEKRALEHAATLMALYLAQQQAAALIESRLNYTLVDALISGEWQNNPMVRDRLKALGYNENSAYRLCMVLFADSKGKFIPNPLGETTEFLQREHMARRIRNALKDLGAPELLTVNLNRVVFLVPHQQVLQERLLQALGIELELCIVGPIVESPQHLPHEFTDLDQVSRTLDQAGVYHYDDLILPRVLGSIRDTRAVERFLQRYVGKLQQNGLQDTLVALVQEGFHYKNTALRLGIHLNSLKYRIGKIEDVLSCDLNHPKVRFELSLAVHLRSTGSYIEPQFG